MEAKQFPEKWAVLDTNEALVVLKRLFDNRLINANDNYGFYEQGNVTGFHCYGTNLHYQYKPFADGYTEVTLEDLIAHYEPKKDETKALIMFCTQEQAVEMGELLAKYGIKNAGESPYTKNKYEHIVNNQDGGFRRVAFVRSAAIDNYNRTLIEYNPTRFLESLGITTHPKWMPLTSKQCKIEEIIEFHNHSIAKLVGVRVPIIFNEKGSSFYVDYGNLIPYNPRIAELEEKITSKRSELAELEGELKELKDK